MQRTFSRRLELLEEGSLGLGAASLEGRAPRRAIRLETRLIADARPIGEGTARRDVRWCGAGVCG